MTRIMHVRRVRRPCDECPVRSDVPPRKFGPERFEALRSTAGSPGQEVPIGAPWFACHKSSDDEERACAGWLVLCGADHLGVRLSIAQGNLPMSALEASKGWPPLYGSYEEMEAANSVTSMKSDTLDSPVAKAVFRIVTYRWRPGAGIARQVLADLGPDRDSKISLEYTRAVLLSLQQSGYLDSRLIDGNDHKGTHRKLIHYRLIRRPGA